MPLYVFLVALFVGLHSSLLAQNNQGQSSHVRVRVDLVAFGETISGLVLSSSSNKKPVTALAFRYSETLVYKGPRIVEISQSGGRKVAEPVDLEKHPDASVLPPEPKAKNPPEGAPQPGKYIKEILKRREKNPDLVALAVIPAGARHVTILLAPSEQETYRAYVINDDPTKLPFGKVRIHNYCKHPIAMRFNNSQPDIIRPFKTRKVTPRNKQVIYQLAYPRRKKWKIQENNLVAVQPDEQVQMIVLRSQSSFFTSSDGSRGGVLQVATLRRKKNPPKIVIPDPSENEDGPKLPEAPKSDPITR